jgi:sugar-specific transcriptional regulator TrmB
MFENNGTTPAEQDTTTLDPAEQIKNLNDTVIMMKGGIENLEAKLQQAEATRQYYFDLAVERYNTIQKARESIEEVLSGDINASQTFDDFKDAFELLGVTLTREVEVEINVTWRGTMTLPVGVDPEDLDIDDFDIEGFPGHNEYPADFNGMYSHEISER